MVSGHVGNFPNVFDSNDNVYSSNALTNITTLGPIILCILLDSISSILLMFCNIDILPPLYKSPFAKKDKASIQ